VSLSDSESFVSKLMQELNEPDTRDGVSARLGGHCRGVEALDAWSDTITNSVLGVLTPHFLAMVVQVYTDPLLFDVMACNP